MGSIGPGLPWQHAGAGWGNHGGMGAGLPWQRGAKDQGYRSDGYRRPGVAMATGTTVWGYDDDGEQRMALPWQRGGVYNHGDAGSG